MTLYDLISFHYRSQGEKAGKENDAEGSSKRRSRSKERLGEEKKRSGGEGSSAARTKSRDPKKVINNVLIQGSPHGKF